MPQIYQRKLSYGELQDLERRQQQAKRILPKVRRPYDNNSPVRNWMRG